MIQENLTQWKSHIASELEKLRACYQADRQNASSRPGAPIDDMIEQVKVLESPLLFKATLSDFYLQLQRQQKRHGHGPATLEQFDKTLLTIDHSLKEFRVDLGTVMTVSDIHGIRIKPGTTACVGGVIEEKLRVIERITGHPIAGIDRRYLFACWSEDTPVNDLLFPLHHRIGISASTNLADLPVSGTTLVICGRLEPKPLIAEWDTLITKYPLDCFFTNDAAIFPLDLSWIATFCHGDYGVFARREVGKTV